MKDFNIDENENMNENVNEQNTHNEPENVNIENTNANHEPAEKPADGTYSYTRENVPNGTYSVNNQSQNQNQNQNQAYSAYRYNPITGEPNQQHVQGTPYAQPSQYTNSYAPQNPYYNGMSQNNGQISYTPDKKKKKEHKSGSISRGAIALVCCLTVVLSGCFGFTGAYLANRINSNNSTGETTSASSSEGTTVVYRSVDDITTSTGVTNGEVMDYSQVAAIVKDSVVEITTEYNVQSMWYQYVTEGAGSGVILSADGYIITNNHVICNEDTGSLADSITVRLTNGDEYSASVIGHDSQADIAVIKIEASGLTFAVAGNSDNLAVGEEVIVVGNPLGELGGTVTNGIVSATQREIQVNSVTMSLIQTNAAVNPGNSGGGMFNMKGELVGIVNAKSSGTGIEGLGFAIPINDALAVNEQLLEYGYVRGRTMIGVSFYDVSSSSFSTFMYYNNVKPGVYVSELTKGYNDDVLREGDRVIAVNDEEIASSSDIKAIVTSASVGDKLTFQLYRDGKLISVEVTCYEKVPDEVESNIEFSENENG